MTNFTAPDQIIIKDIKDGRATIERSVKSIHDTEGCKFGGYGKAVIENQPLRVYLSRNEWRELTGARRLHAKGEYAELYRKYGTNDLGTIEARILAVAKMHPKEYRKTRYGTKYVNSGEIGERYAAAEASKT